MDKTKPCEIFQILPDGNLFHVPNAAFTNRKSAVRWLKKNRELLTEYKISEIFEPTPVQQYQVSKVLPDGLLSKIIDINFSTQEEAKQWLEDTALLAQSLS